MIASYEKTIYKNEDNGFCILRMVSEEKGLFPKEALEQLNSRYDKIRFSVKGYYLPERANMMLELNGKWENSKYGLQYMVDSFREIIPKTKDGIAAYLSSGLIQGVGPATATLIVSKFGLDTLEVLEHEPERLLEVRGITQKKLDKIRQSFADSQSIRELMTFLSPYGISINKAKKIQEAFGVNAVETIKNRPFALCEISGFGFLTVDEIARKINFQPDDPLRIEGAIMYVLEEGKDHGNVYLPESEVLKKALAMLNEKCEDTPVSESKIQKVFDLMQKKKTIISEHEQVYLPKLYLYEKETAKNIAALLCRKKKPEDCKKFLEEAQKENGIWLSEAQSQAVEMCMEHPFSIITGGPGTGKTTVLKVILAVYGKMFQGKEVLLAAPTGRAARKMSESTGYPNASTLHSALSLTSDANEQDTTVLSADFIIVDEASMLDMQLAYHLFEALASGTKVLFVGDIDQLPSVGAGNVLSELIGCGLVPVTVLDTVFRQQNTSRIALNAHAMKKGDTKLLYGDDFQFIDVSDVAEAVQSIQEIYQRAVKTYGLEQVQVLSPFRLKSDAGVKNLNQMLRELANPLINKTMELSYGSTSFRFGDKVMQTKNTEVASNGDIGFIAKVDKNNDDVLTVKFSDHRCKTYTIDELNQLELAYATTIHKSQGSEYECVILPILSSFYVMLQRALIYTAITRAKKKVILVGQKKALFMAIHKNSSVKRYTWLGKRIQDAYKKKTEGKKTAVVHTKIPEQLAL